MARTVPSRLAWIHAAAHVVDILEAAAASITAEGRPMEVTSTFVAPQLMPWASIREDVTQASEMP